MILMIMIFYSFIIIIISMMIWMINIMFMKQLNKQREKNSSFECGFTPMSQNRLPFSIQFFFIAIIFLIFDVELTLLFPLIKMIYFLKNYWISISIFIFLILILGIFNEWKNNLINWFN